jgi:hypothetical protein
MRSAAASPSSLPPALPRAVPRAVPLVFLLAVPLAPPPAHAGTVTYNHSAAPDATVDIEIVSGSIHVLAWEKNEVAVAGTVGSGVSELAVAGSDRNVRISIETDGDDHRGRRDISADLEIKVPRGAKVNVETVSAPVTVDGTTGEVRIESVSGDVTVGGAPRRADLQVVSGRIRLKSSAPVEYFGAETVSGDIEFEGGLDRRAELNAQSVSGRITLRLPAATAADFDVSTFSGGIANDFGPQAEQTSKYVPSKELSFATNGGGADVTVESFSGAIALKKL